MSIQVLEGDCREVLRTLPDASVQCVVTSPPYFGLRDYGTASWEGGDAECDHVVGEIRTGLGLAKLGERYRGGGHKQAEVGKITAKGECPKCGARRVDRQIGLEPSPDEYVAQMVDVFGEVRRVLRDDGTVWLNIGDSYASGGRQTRDPGKSKLHPAFVGDAFRAGLRPRDPDGIKPKDLLGIPWRVAFALQADGWWLRSAIVWAKPNPMPESVTDRPTSSYEMLFLFAKSERYFYDADAVREDYSPATHARLSQATFDGQTGGPKDPKTGNRSARRALENLKARVDAAGSGRNLRNVWTIATQPYSDAHFATMPPELAERCVKAGTSEKGCCRQCGAPWRRMVRKERMRDGEPLAGGWHNGGGYRIGATGVGHWRDTTVAETMGWQPTCECDAGDPVPCTVLDPFGGAGTTGLVADRLNRNAILVELNPDYAEMARRRIQKDAGLFAEIA